MKLSCGQWCHIQEILANLKCPRCFSSKVKLCPEEKEQNAQCEKCNCEFTFSPDLKDRWD